MKPPPCWEFAGEAKRKLAMELAVVKDKLCGTSSVLPATSSGDTLACGAWMGPEIQL